MGNLTLNGATSGQITLAPTAVAGTNTLTLPAATGTVLTTAGGQTISGTTTVTTLNATTIQVGGNQAVNGPAFSAYLNANQTATANVVTKITFNTEDFDTNNNFDANTNYRFTPAVAGYYQVNLNATIRNSAGGTSSALYLYKNGSPYKGSQNDSSGANYNVAFAINCVVYLNGSTDYIEGYVGAGAGTTTAYSTYTVGGVNTAYLTNFSACLLRGA